jgi:hypothetical protein
VRQDVGHQRALIVGAIYTSQTANGILDLSRGHEVAAKALKHCIRKHPILSAVIVNGSAEKPSFGLLETLDLSRHIEMRNLDNSVPEHERIEQILATVSDEEFLSVDQHPPWKVVISPLPDQDGSAARVLVLFAYYHSHGDGKSGLAFHRTFLEGLQDEAARKKSSDMAFSRLQPSMEEVGKLSLSLSYLLAPLLGLYLPGFLAKMLGFRASAVSPEDGTWSGKDFCFDPNNFRTGLAMVTIDHNTMQNALQRCRSRQTSFTGLLNQLIAKALHAELGPEHASKTFVTQIVVDLRRLFPGTFSDETMMNCVSAYYETIASPSAADEKWTTPTSEIWTAARNTTAELVKTAGTLHNQPIGLLQYLHNFRSWTLGQIGKKREGSYEISNLVVFDPVLRSAETTATEKPKDLNPDAVRIEKTIFAQPAAAAGPCLNFNLVTTKGGPLVMTATWQQGVLDLGNVKQEADFVRKVCERIEDDVSTLSMASL